MSASNGITGKAGRWSARHPWTAITLWVAFVAAAVVIGGAVGTKKLSEADSGSGESGVAARTLDRAGCSAILVEQPPLEARWAAVQDRLPDLEVRSGGSTSVDITRRGIDKAGSGARFWSATPSVSASDARTAAVHPPRVRAPGQENETGRGRPGFPPPRE